MFYLLTCTFDHIVLSLDVFGFGRYVAIVNIFGLEVVAQMARTMGVGARDHI